MAKRHKLTHEEVEERIIRALNGESMTGKARGPLLSKLLDLARKKK